MQDAPVNTMVSALCQHHVKVRVYLRRSRVRQQIPNNEWKPISRTAVVNMLEPASQLTVKNYDNYHVTLLFTQCME